MLDMQAEGVATLFVLDMQAVFVLDMQAEGVARMDLRSLELRLHVCVHKHKNVVGSDCTHDEDRQHVQPAKILDPGVCVCVCGNARRAWISKVV